MNYKASAGIPLVNNYGMILLRTLVLLILFFLFTSVNLHSKAVSPVKKGETPRGKTEKRLKNKGCAYSKKEEDKEAGTVLKIMERERIASYTPPNAVEAFTEFDFLTIDANLSNVNGSLALFLKITLNTDDPHPLYGSIYKDDKLMLKLKNGEKITLYSGQSENGNIDYATGKSDYVTFFDLDDDAIKSLQRSELTMARLFWSKGYEDYKILNPDFFIRQITCASR